MTRFKGLGEMNPPQLRESTIHPDTRRLVQLTVDDGEQTRSPQLRESTIHPDTRRLVQLTVDDGEQTRSLMDMLLAKRASDPEAGWRARATWRRWKSDPAPSSGVPAAGRHPRHPRDQGRSASGRHYRFMRPGITPPSANPAEP